MTLVRPGFHPHQAIAPMAWTSWIGVSAGQKEPNARMPMHDEDHHRLRRESGKSRNRQAVGANLSATRRHCPAGSDGGRKFPCRTGRCTALARSDRNSAVVAGGPPTHQRAPGRQGSFKPNGAVSSSATRPDAFHHQGMRKEPV